jgi:hypothetical protein
VSALRALRRATLQFTTEFAQFIASAWRASAPLPTVHASTTRVVSNVRDIEMMKNAESVFFLLATVAALALPAVPALQEALTADYATVEAAAPTVVMERVIVMAPSKPLPWQVAEVR